MLSLGNQNMKNIFVEQCPQVNNLAENEETELFIWTQCGPATLTAC